MVQPSPQGEVIAGVDTDEGQLLIEIRDKHFAVCFDDDGRINGISSLLRKKDIEYDNTCTGKRG